MNSFTIYRKSGTERTFFCFHYLIKLAFKLLLYFSLQLQSNFRFNSVLTTERGWPQNLQSPIHQCTMPCHRMKATQPKLHHPTSTLSDSSRQSERIPRAQPTLPSQPWTSFVAQSSLHVACWSIPSYQLLRSSLAPLIRTAAPFSQKSPSGW